MEDRYDISVDIGNGKDYSVTTLFEDGEYRPIGVCDAISFGGDVEHSGYVGVDEEYTTPKCDLMVEATDKRVYYPNVSATFRRK